MPRRRRRQFTLVEWLIVIIIAGVLFAITAPSRPPRGRTVRPTVPAPAARPRPPVELPDADRRPTSPPSPLRLWRRVQNPLALALALHAISRAFRRRRPQSPARQHSPSP